MMAKLVLAVFFLVLVVVWVPHTEASARLLASKTILNEYAVEGKDLTVCYSIYNVGTSPAQSVVLDDGSFPPDEFSVVQGLLAASWDRLPHNSNVTHTVILRPLVPGKYNISWGKVTYITDEKGKEQVGYTSTPGYLQVTPYPDFSRRHENHVMDWLAFLVMSAPTILLPFLLWYRSYSKYEKLKIKKA